MPLFWATCSADGQLTRQRNLAPYISFFLLAFVGVKMLVEGDKGRKSAM